MNNNDIKIKTRKKLIEIALPLNAINTASVHEKKPGIGPHPRGLHHWLARRPLSTARAVIFAQMVDDPSAHPEIFPTEQAQEKERQRLFNIIQELVQWENTTNEEVLQRARDEIWQSWSSTCAENEGHPQADELFDVNVLPAFHDPFGGGGALPLEAQRLGLESYASDLNPVAVMIMKMMIEIPPNFAGRAPVNLESKTDNRLMVRDWKGAEGLADDVRYYGQWMRDEAEKRISHLYPKVAITAEMAVERPDLKQYVGQNLTVIAWLWARTVKSQNPAFASVNVPLASTFMLSTKAGKEAYVEPVIEDGGYRFIVKVGKPRDPDAAKNGTKLGRGANFQCIMSETPMASDYVKDEFKNKRNGTRLMAIVAQGNRGRVYLSPTLEQENSARTKRPEGVLDQEMNQKSYDLVSGRGYGITHWYEIYSPRQLVALTTFSDLVHEARERIERDAIAAGLPDDGKPLRDGGTGATAYAEAIAVYLVFILNRCADFGTSVSRWAPSNEKAMNLFSKQVIPLTWDFPEVDIIADVVGGFAPAAKYVADCINTLCLNGVRGFVSQQDAQQQIVSTNKLVSTDPPYYNNMAYADLSDFFYLWMRRSLRTIFPDIFATLSVPKAKELVATPYRHGSKQAAEIFWRDGMTDAMRQLAQQVHPAFPVTIYYAFKQSETTDTTGTINTGWDTFLEAVIQAGFAITGTWPMRTEGSGRLLALGTNALASSIVLVCRPLNPAAKTTTRREFIVMLNETLPNAIKQLQSANLAPVDLAQSVIGPGMAIYTQYSRILDASGESMSVGDALSLINRTMDDVLTKQEGDLDADSRFALTWFEQQGFSEGDYGVAETLSMSRNTSIDGMVQAGILVSGRGKVRLLRPDELPEDWDPTTDKRTPAWESVHHLVRALEAGGESDAAELMSKLGAGKSEVARELAYRLYNICERKNWAREALSYNALVQSWPEISRLARQESLEQQSSFL